MVHPTRIEALEPSVSDWLLDSDPAIRWQTLADLTDASPSTVAAERAMVATTGWGERLLALQQQDGNWGGGSYTPKWTSTTYTLLLLRHFGIDPDDPEMQRCVGRVRDRVTLAEQPFFSYRGETCITGMALSLGATFRADGAATDLVAEHLLDEQLADGGWNCATRRGSRRASFHTTISVLEGLSDYAQSRGAAVDDASRRGAEYLLDRSLLRRLSTGEVVSPSFRLISFPPRWHYDVLRGLEYLRGAGFEPDERCREAIELIEAKRTRDGRWPLQNHHRGQEHFAMEEGTGKPSRWNTLRARRVLDWFHGGPQPE